MPTATLTDSNTAKPPPTSTPPVGTSVTPPTDMLDTIWDELRTYHAAMLRFHDMEPDEVLLAVSGFSARCSEVRAHLNRSQNRAATSFKNNIVEPLLADLEFQFRIHSRVQAIRDWDLRLSGGQT